MSRDSRVSEHIDTKSVNDPESSPLHDTVILAKRRPSGNSNNRCVAKWIPPTALSSRDPVSLGDVEGAFHPAASWDRRETSIRSSRRGKEQTRSKTSGEVEARRSD